jgi:hypothetical protein
MGHGEAIGSEQILVPGHMSISFLIDEGRVMPFSNGVGLVMNPQSLQSEGFTLSSFHGGGDEISNHRLHVLNSDQRAWYAQVDPEDGSCCYAGEHFESGLRLCEDPGEQGQCAQNPDGVHTCGGLFSFTWQDNDLVWVSCRKEVTESGTLPQLNYGNAVPRGQKQPTSEYYDFADQVLAKLNSMSATDFASYFDSLSAEEKAVVMFKKEIKEWSYRREARNWLAKGATDEDFYAFVAGQGEEAATTYLSDRDLKARFARGKFVRQAREYWQANGEDNFRLYAYRLDAQSRAVLEAYPDMAKALAVPDSGAVGDAQRYGIDFDEIDWSMVQGINEKVLKDADERAQVPYWQTQGKLLIGMEQPDVYRKLMERARDRASGQEPTGQRPNGQITVVSRGGFGSRGKLRVGGRCDQAVVTQWIGAFSKKSVTFG